MCVREREGERENSLMLETEITQMSLLPGLTGIPPTSHSLTLALSLSFHLFIPHIKEQRERVCERE